MKQSMRFANKAAESNAVRGVYFRARSLRSHFRTQTTPHTAQLTAALG